MRTICLTLYLFKREIMAKGKKTSGKEKGLYTDPATLIMELFRTLPDKRYSVKSLSAAAGAATREQKDQVRAIVHDFLRYPRENTASAVRSAKRSKERSI